MPRTWCACQGILRAHAFSVDGWKRLLTGRIDLIRQSKLVGQRLLWSLTLRARALLRPLRIRLPVLKRLLSQSLPPATMPDLSRHVHRSADTLLPIASESIVHDGTGDP